MKMNEKDLIHPHKKKWIKTGDPELNELLPRLSDEEKSYLELITSTGYNDLVSRIKYYTGISPEDLDIPQLIGLLQQTLSTVLRIEKKNKRTLEKLAIQMVLDQEEFVMVKTAVESGDVIIRAALKIPEIQLPMEGEEEVELGELSPDEEENFDVAKDLMNLSDIELRRRLSNILIQGSAVLKTYSFNLEKGKLELVDKRLPKLYGVLSVLAQLGYWISPDGIEKISASSGSVAGAEQVKPQGDIYIIQAEAITFPFLVHEIVKGIYDWINIDPEFSELRRKGVEAETRDIIVGPEIFKAISSYMGEKQYLLPLVQKKILQLDREDIRNILLKNSIGKEIMNDIISSSEEEWEEYLESGSK